MIHSHDSLRDAAGLFRFRGAPLLGCLLMFGLGAAAAHADLTFNIEYVGEATHTGSPQTSLFYAEVWGEGNYAYVGSNQVGQGVSIFDISNPASPQFLTMYPGTRMEDVEVYNGIGFFSSEGSTTGTGVDIVNLSNPANPVMLSRVDSSNNGHQVVHTLSVFDNYLYTADNRTNTVKVFDVSNPSQPQYVDTLILPGMDSRVATHQITALDGRLYTSSKWNGSNTDHGWTHIYDVSNVGTTGATLLKAFKSGPRTHSAWPTEDHNILVVCEERPNGEVHIFDISMINEPNDPNEPVLLKTLNRTNVGIQAHSPHNPLIHGNLLFISWYEAGIQVFNIADPANPVHVGAFDTYVGTNTNFSGAWGVYPYLGLDRVLIGDRQRGLIIVDATGVLAPGDYAQLGIVDERSFDVWRDSFGTNDPAADGNNDGTVDAADYVLWRKNVGQLLPPNLAGGSSNHAPPAVPEPSALLLLAIGLTAVRPHRLRRATRRHHCDL